MSTAQDEAALLNKLQSQFGDMDLTHLLNEEEKKEDDGYGSDESSLKEPTQEELQAWQDSQFKKGQEELEVKKRLEMTPLQRRRELKKRYSVEDDDEWEQVAALPDLEGQSSVFFPSSDEKGNEFLGAHPMLLQFAQGDPEVLGTKWLRLSSSTEGDGLSFLNLLNTVKGYHGPTVILIGAVPSAARSISSGEKKRTTLGFYSTSPWTESTDFFGSSDCFLFAFDEEESEVKFFRPMDGKDKNKKHYMYCHPSALNVTKRRSKKMVQGLATDGSVHGMGVGGTPSQPRLHLTETLEECRAMEFCQLFEAGDLLMGNGVDSLYYFDVDCLEVWGVGGETWIQESLATRQKERDLSQANMRRARQVDKKPFLQDFRSGLVGSNKQPGLFDHMQHTTDRADL